MRTGAWLAYGGLAGLAVLYATWPGSPAAAGLGVAALATAALLTWRGETRWALAGLGLAAAAAVGLRATAATWHAWLAPLPALVALDGLLRADAGGPPPAPRPARLAGLLAGLGALAAFLAVWRPTRTLVWGESGAVAVNLVAAALVAAIGLWVTAPEGGRDPAG